MFLEKITWVQAKEYFEKKILRSFRSEAQKTMDPSFVWEQIF